MGGTQLDFRLSGFIWCSVYPPEKQDRHKICTNVALCTEAWIIFHVIIFLPMEFSRQEYRSGLSFPFPGDLPNPGIEPGSPALQTDALLSVLPWKQALNYFSRVSFIWLQYYMFYLYKNILQFQYAIKLTCTKNFYIFFFYHPVDLFSLISHPPVGAL